MLCILTMGLALALAGDEPASPIDLEAVERMRSGLEAARDAQGESALDFADRLMSSADRIREAQDGAFPDSVDLARQGSGAVGEMFGGDLNIEGMFEPEVLEGPVLYVLVSLGMPDEALRGLVREADELNGTIVIRGFYGGDWQQTQARIMDLFEEDETGGLMIDPRPFQAFGVSAVPAIIRSDHGVVPCGELGCIPETPPHDIVRGNISIRAALEIMGHIIPSY